MGPRALAYARVPEHTVLAAILVLAAVLRALGLVRHSLWSDEVYVLWLSRAPWGTFFHLIAATDFHPPFYYALMKAWIGVAGTGEAALRGPSAAASIASVWLTYHLVRRLGSGEVALLSALLVAVSPFHIMAAQEARMYPLLGALTLGATLALLGAVGRGGVARWLLYAAVAAALVSTMYAGALVVAAHGAWVAGWERRHLRAWLAAAAGAAAVCLPWWPALWTQVQGRGFYTQIAVQEGRPAPSAAAALSQVQDLVGLLAFGGWLFGTAGYLTGATSPPLDRMVVGLPFLATLCCGLVARPLRRPDRALLLLPPGVTAGAMAAASIVAPVFSPRWFSFLVPFWAAILAFGIVSLAASVRAPRAAVITAWTAGLLLYALPVLHAYFWVPSTWPFRWRDAAAFVGHHALSGDALLYADAPSRATFTYYFKDRYPSFVLPAPGASGQAPGMTAAQARGFSVRYSRVWLVVNGPAPPALVGQTLPALAAVFRIRAAGDFGGATLYLLTRGAGGAP